MNYPHTGEVKRLQQNGLQESFVVVGTISCFLQPLGDREVSELQDTYSQPHKCLVDINADVRESDTIDILNQGFRVRGIRRYEFGGNPHKRLLLERLG